MRRMGKDLKDGCGGCLAVVPGEWVVPLPSLPLALTPGPSPAERERGTPPPGPGHPLQNSSVSPLGKRRGGSRIGLYNHALPLPVHPWVPAFAGMTGRAEMTVGEDWNGDGCMKNVIAKQFDNSNIRAIIAVSLIDRLALHRWLRPPPVFEGTGIALGGGTPSFEEAPLHIPLATFAPLVAKGIVGRRRIKGENEKWLI